MITLEQMRKHREAKKTVQTATATDTAEAMDAGTSAGVKKSWLKRERAKQDAAVDTLDKGKIDASDVSSKDLKAAHNALAKIMADRKMRMYPIMYKKQSKRDEAFNEAHERIASVLRGEEPIQAEWYPQCLAAMGKRDAYDYPIVKEMMKAERAAQKNKAAEAAKAANAPLDKWAKMTDDNDHTAVRKEIADWTKKYLETKGDHDGAEQADCFSKFFDAFAEMQDENQEAGMGISRKMLYFREDATQMVLKLVAKHDVSLARDINGSL